MSTFDGFLEEFPDIRIDYFRKLQDRPPPLACFLSHVHSDHLQGLESLKSPFIYCSAATRELLLRLENYPHRMNFAKGILETRQVHYRHLKTLLKAIPLNVPTEIELSPGRTIRATLFDANHCAGAVMFLIDDATKAVLYTGDIRAESWWVNTIAREPVLIPYTTGLRDLDNIYLDTTFATKKDPYRHFPTKAEGLQELLKKVAAYPDNTVFHFNAWTFGYEPVWTALATALRSQVHVDRYKWGLYNSLARCSGVPPYEGSALCGFQCGNRYQGGCLTTESSVRLHSCERGIQCDTLKFSDTVWITPIITRASSGGEIPELGAGGGGSDLERSHQIDLLDPQAVMELMKLCSDTIRDPEERKKVLTLVAEAMVSGRIDVRLAELNSIEDLEDLPLENLVVLLQKIVNSKLYNISPWECCARSGNSIAQKSGVVREELSKQITFSYSRHSSYDELCHLVEIFKPKDIYPCTVNDLTWSHEVSMEALFGHLCSGQSFLHDQKMTGIYKNREAKSHHKRRASCEQTICTSDSSRVQFGSTTPTRIESTLGRYGSNRVSKKVRTGGHGGITTSSAVLITDQTVTSLSNLSSGEKRMQAIKTCFEANDHKVDKDSLSKSDRVMLESISPCARGKIITRNRCGNHFRELGSTVEHPIEVTEDPELPGSPQKNRVAKSSMFQYKAHISAEVALNISVESSIEDGSITETESQLSLPDSAFESQHSTQRNTQGSRSKISTRKAAYIAVIGRDGVDWAAYSPMSSSKDLIKDEIELE